MGMASNLRDLFHVNVNGDQPLYVAVGMLNAAGA